MSSLGGRKPSEGPYEIVLLPYSREDRYTACSEDPPYTIATLC